MRRRSAFATMAGSTATSLVAAVQSLVLLPLYLSSIGAGPYGVWLATGEVLAWLLAFDFGIPNLLIQRTGASLARGEQRAIGAHFLASLVSLAALALIVFGAVWFFAPFVGRDFAQPLRIAGLATAMTVVSYGFVGLSRGLQRTGLVQAFSLAGVVAGFALTAWMLLAGHGLVAIACGLLARAALTLFGGVLFFALQVDHRVLQGVRFECAPFRDIARNCPPMFVAGLAHAVTTNSMVTLAAVMFRPEVATVLGVTRKAAEIVRMLLDMLGHAAYGGFANLFESDRPRAAGVYRELQATFFLLATPLMAAYVAVNPALVTVWVGDEMFGGSLLTLLLAIGMTAGSWSYLQASVLRSMGEHSRSSAVVLVECCARLVLMVLLGSLFGIEGLALGAIVTAVVAGAWSSRRIAHRLGGLQTAYRDWILRILPIFAAFLAAAYWPLSSWAVVLAMGSLVVVLVGVALVWLDPMLKDRYVRGGA